MRAQRGAAGAVRARLPAGAEPGGGLGLERLPQFSEIALTELEPADAERLIRSKLEQLFGAGTEAPAGARRARHRRARRATRSTSRSCSTTSAGRASTSRTTRRFATLELPEQPAQPDPQPHRHARRGAAPHAQGRERASDGRSSPRRCPASIRSSARRTTSAPTSPRCARADLVTLDREDERGLHLQARRHPGGDLREPALRHPRDAPRARRRLHRGDRGRRDRASARPARAPLLAQREHGEEARVPRARRRGGRRRATPTRPRSTTSSAPPRSCPSRSASTCCCGSARCVS